MSVDRNTSLSPAIPWSSLSFFPSYFVSFKDVEFVMPLAVSLVCCSTFLLVWWSGPQLIDGQMSQMQTLMCLSEWFRGTCTY